MGRPLLPVSPPFTVAAAVDIEDPALASARPTCPPPPPSLLAHSSARRWGSTSSNGSDASMSSERLLGVELEFARQGMLTPPLSPAGAATTLAAEDSNDGRADRSSEWLSIQASSSAQAAALDATGVSPGQEQEEAREALDRIRDAAAASSADEIGRAQGSPRRPASPPAAHSELGFLAGSQSDVWSDESEPEDGLIHDDTDDHFSVNDEADGTLTTPFGRARNSDDDDRAGERSHCVSQSNLLAPSSPTPWPRLSFSLSPSPSYQSHSSHESLPLYQLSPFAHASALPPQSIPSLLFPLPRSTAVPAARVSPAAPSLSSKLLRSLPHLLLPPLFLLVPIAFSLWLLGDLYYYLGLVMGFYSSAYRAAFWAIVTAASIAYGYFGFWMVVRVGRGLIGVWGSSGQRHRHRRRRRRRRGVGESERRWGKARLQEGVSGIRIGIGLA